MNKEDVLTWLTQLGTGWVGLAEVYHMYKPDDEDVMAFWDKLTNWHDGAYVTKRMNMKNMEVKDHDVEQYRLTKRAIDSLNE